MTERKTSAGCATFAGTAAAIVVVAILTAAAIIAVATLPFMWAWAAFMTPVFGLPLLSFAEGFGAMTILGILSVFFKVTVTKTSK